MIKKVKRTVIAISACVFSFAGANAASNNSANLLKYVPADTPYIFASKKALPSKLADKLEPTFDGILQAYQRVLRHIMAEQLVKMSSEEVGAEKAEQFRGLMEEILGLMSIDGIRGAGIGRDSAFAFYGYGVLPVMRLELSDTELFDAAVQRIEAKAGTAMLIGEAGGRAYKYVDVEKIRLIIATLNDQAVITVVPTTFDADQLALVLAVKAPRDNLKRSKTLRAIEKQYGFTAHLTGFVDVERLAGIFTGDTTDSDDALFTALGEKLPELSDACADEIMGMAGIAPRIVVGYSELSTQQIESKMVIELRADIAAELATIPAPVPGLGMDPGGLMSFGIGLSPLALRDFYEARLDAMEAKPYECEKFATLQAGVAKGREVLDQQLPPVVYSFRGFVANIADIQGLDMGSKTPPDSIDASILVAVENAESLILMAAMMDPQIAAMNLVPDGKPVRLELAALAKYAEEAFAALSADALSISLGTDAETKSAEMLLADNAEPAPFMSMNVDSARYYSMIGELMSQESAGDEQTETPKAIRDAMSEVMSLSGSLYERISVDVQFTARGVEIDSRMKLSE